MSAQLDLVGLTRALVDIDSTTGHEGEAGRWLADFLRSQSFTVVEQRVDEHRFNVLATVAPDPVVVFSTHFDCVPPFFPSRIEGGRIYGRGSCDAKGILAAQIAAADRLRREGETRVGLLFVVGEERGSDGAKTSAPLARGCRFLINGEPTDLRLGLATRGLYRVRLKASGRAAHSAFPELGESAIDRLIDALVMLRAIVLPSDPVLGTTHYTVGLISGGVAPNVVSPSAEAELLFRTVTEADEVHRALSPLESLVTLEPVFDMPPVTMITVPGLDTAVFPYGTDIPFLGAWGSPLLYGPGSIHVAHTADEHLDIGEQRAAVDGYVHIARALLARAADAVADWDPHAEYARRLTERAAATATAQRTHLFVSNLRLVVVALAALLLYAVLAPKIVAPAWLFVPALIFAPLMIWHARVLNARDRARRAEAYYHRGVSRMDGTWVGSGPDGARFLAGHRYASDLDLFGDGSLFQLLTTARTEAGEETLGKWLAQPATASDVMARQGAVAELRERIDFREQLAVLAAEAHVSRTGTLARWSQKAPAGLSTLHGWLFASCALVTVVLVAAAAFTDQVSTLDVVLWLAVQSAMASIWRLRVGQVLRGVDAAANDLGLLTELLERIESETFRSLQLKALHRALVADGTPPSRRIAQLQFLLAVRDAPRNEIVRPFAMLLLVRSQAAVAIDRWHAAHRDALALWLEAVGELEALASLATYAYEHPDDVFPVLAAEPAQFVARGLAHPLIPERTAVRNDVTLGGDAPCVLIVSGSNMSGKSTLLRAVGTNTTLALAGGPVRAHALTLSPLGLGATIRVHDSLQQGQSHFYAEILRIRDIVEQATAGSGAVLFLLDEILHGTNSFDRRIGADAIVRALVEAGAIGLVTTHDLALTALSEVLGPRARNVHFEDRIENGVMSFDYTMRDGVVERSNALELMRSVGLKV